MALATFKHVTLSTIRISIGKLANRTFWSYISPNRNSALLPKSSTEFGAHCATGVNLSVRELISGHKANLSSDLVLPAVKRGPPNLTEDRAIFEMWLSLSHSPKSLTART